MSKQSNHIGLRICLATHTQIRHSLEREAGGPHMPFFDCACFPAHPSLATLQVGRRLPQETRGTQAVVALTLLDLATMSNIPCKRTEYTPEAPAESVSELLAAFSEASLRWQAHVCTYPDVPGA